MAGRFAAEKITKFYRDNPRIQTAPFSQWQWNDFTQELGKIMFERKGSFTPTWSGFSSDPVGGIVSWGIAGSTATLHISVSANGTSNATNFSITNLPDILSPNQTQAVAVNTLLDNGTNGWGNAIIEGSIIRFCFQETDSSSWTGSGSKGFGNASSVPTSITYNLTL